MLAESPVYSIAISDYTVMGVVTGGRGMFSRVFSDGKCTSITEEIKELSSKIQAPCFTPFFKQVVNNEQENLVKNRQ